MKDKYLYFVREGEKKQHIPNLCEFQFKLYFDKNRVKTEHGLAS